MKTSLALALTLALASTAACGSKKEPAKPVTPVENRVAEQQPATKKSLVDEAGAQALALVDAMVQAINSAGEDCPKMGANLRALTPQIKAAVAMEKEIDKDEATKAEFKQKYEPQLEAKLQDSLPKLGSCMNDESVKAFIEEMGN